MGVNFSSKRRFDVDTYGARISAVVSAESSESVKELSSTSFGYLIAFLLPGIFGLYALGRWFPEIQDVLKRVLTPDATVGPSFIVLMVAIGVGVCISGVRFFLFERAIFHGRKAPDYHDMDDKALARQTAIVDHLYRFHQFYGNCAVATLILYAAWVRIWHHMLSQSIGWTLGFVALETLLVASACDSFIKYDVCRQVKPRAKEASAP